ncbi:hypothetical protein GH714_042676 [Hevea brasiliensis]|uniref:Thiamine-phosphate kinase n=1 Tax=Hevea brasiliensis TaxID=3981 RepID=A0A6A6JZ37_HEVBR|nr:hypothetical protein GH714_042676 [Hevea brasiliensis]
MREVEVEKLKVPNDMQHSSTSVHTYPITTETSNMDEFACIERYIRPLMRSGFGTENDDAGKISSPNGSFIVTQDILVEGIHFLPNSNPALLAKKALRVNLSDLAAMGAQPHGYVLGMSLPQGVTEDWWKEFSNGLREDNTHYNVNLMGGTRHLTTRGLIEGEYLTLKYRYDLPEPRITLGSKICSIASACIDISDGLVQDIGHICRLSNVGARVHLDQIPISDEARDVLRHNPELIERICSGGDDYELAFTSAAENHTQIMLIAADLGVKVTKVGTIVAQPGVRVYDSKGSIIRLTHHGYRHRF